MTSVTLTKPASSAIATDGVNSAQPSWWTNVRIVEPFWTQSTLGTSFTLSDELHGAATLTGTMGATPGFSWDTAGNGSGTNGLVGLALKLAPNTGSENVAASNAIFSNKTDSSLVVIKPNAGGSRGVVSVFGMGSSAYLEVDVNSAGNVQLYSGWSSATIWTSASAIPIDEWHVLGWSLDVSDLSAGQFNIAIDGVADANNTDTAGTITIPNFNAEVESLWFGNGNGAWSAHEFAFLVDWSDAKSTAFLETITAASNTASVGPYQMITMGSVAPVPSYRPNRLVYRRVSS